jgi:hypothetical protein
MAHSPPVIIFTFETTHDALWAEEVAQENGLPAEVAPAPPEVDAKCGLSIRTPATQADRMAEVFRAEGIGFGRVEDPGSGS